VTRRKSAMSPDETSAAKRRLAHRASAGRLTWSAGIREMRLVLGKTQEGFGKIFGISRRKIVALEKGEGNPELATLKRFGSAFGLTIGYVPVEQPSDRWVVASAQIGAPAMPKPGDVIMITAPDPEPIFRLMPSAIQSLWGFGCLATGCRLILEEPLPDRNPNQNHGKHGDVGRILEIRRPSEHAAQSIMDSWMLIYEKIA
jgi:DNA-binding XRE family transcriptional regulator